MERPYQINPNKERLNLAPGLDLPIETAMFSKIAILAATNAGKTYCAGVIAEEMLLGGRQIIVVDPTGGWWGLAFDSSGIKPALNISIIGGKHDNTGHSVKQGQHRIDLLSFDDTATKNLVTYILSSRRPVIFDTSKADNYGIEFVGKFIKELMFQKDDRYPQKIHFFIDEAHIFAPQKISAIKRRDKEIAEETHKQVSRLATQGRHYGLGCTMICQRIQLIDKTLVSQAELFIALRMQGYNDLELLLKWIAGKNDIEALRSKIPTLGKGNAYAYSPGEWLNMPKATLFHIKKKITFDSSKTHEGGAPLALDPSVPIALPPMPHVFAIKASERKFLEVEGGTAIGVSGELAVALLFNKPTDFAQCMIVGRIKAGWQELHDLKQITTEYKQFALYFNNPTLSSHYEGLLIEQSYLLKR